MITKAEMKLFSKEKSIQDSWWVNSFIIKRKHAGNKQGIILIK